MYILLKPLPQGDFGAWVGPGQTTHPDIPGQGLIRSWPGCPSNAPSIFSKRAWVGTAQTLAGPGLATRTHCWRFRWGFGWVHDVKPGQALGWPHKGGVWAHHAKPRQVLGWLIDHAPCKT